MGTSVTRTADLEISFFEEAAELGAPAFAGLPGAGFLVVDTSFRILLAAGHAIRDEVRDGVRTRRVPEVIPASAWTVLRPRYEAALGGEVQEFDYEAERDGSSHHVRLAPLWAGTTITGVTVIIQDITAHTTATRLLAESDRRLSSVFEVLDEGVLVIDSTGQILQANPAARRIVGAELRPPVGGARVVGAARRAVLVRRHARDRRTDGPGLGGAGARRRSGDRWSRR